MAFNIGGLASGLDTNSMIDQLLQIERKPVAALQLKQKLAVGRADTFKDMATRLTSLKDRSFDLSVASVWTPHKGASSNAAIVDVTAGATASDASYKINVEALAAAHVVRSAQQTDSTNALGLAGTFSLNGKNVTVAAGDSLSAIRDKINSTTDIGAKASIVDNTLRIARTSTGATELTFVDDVGTGVLKALEVLDAGDLIKNELVAASDSKVKIDGQVVERSTNTISDAVTGVTFTLKGTNPTPGDAVSVTVGLDVDSILSKIKAYVDQYNSTQEFMYGKVSEAKVSKPKSESDSLKGLLSGDVVVSQLQSGLRTDVTSTVSGQPSATNSLAMIGITGIKNSAGGSISPEAAYGKLVIDDTKLRAAITADPNAVKELFVSGYGGAFNQSTAGIATRTYEHTKIMLGTGRGITAMESNARSENNRLQTRIDNLEDRVARKEKQLINQFARLESALSTYQSQGQWLSSQVAKLPGFGS